MARGGEMLLVVVLMMTLDKGDLVPLAPADRKEPSYEVTRDLGPGISYPGLDRISGSPSVGARPILRTLGRANLPADDERPPSTATAPILGVPEEPAASLHRPEDGSHSASKLDYEVKQASTVPPSYSVEHPNSMSPSIPDPLFPDANQLTAHSAHNFPNPLPPLPNLGPLRNSAPQHHNQPMYSDHSNHFMHHDKATLPHHPMHPNQPEAALPNSDQSASVTLDLERFRPIIPYLDQIIRGINKPKSKSNVIPFNPPPEVNASAPILLELYIDVQCPYSEQAYSFLSDLAHLYGPSQVKFKAKIFPMPHRRGSFYIAKAVKAVYKLTDHRKANAFLTLLFNVKRTLTNEALRTVSDVELAQRLADMAALLRVERSDFAELLENETLSNYTLWGWEKALQRGVSGTPTLLVNGEEMEFQSPLTLPQVLDFMRRLSALGPSEKVSKEKAPTQPSSAVVMLQERTLIWNSFFPPGDHGAMNQDKVTATLYTN